MLPRPANRASLAGDLHDADGSAAGAAHPLVSSLEQRGRLACGLIEDGGHSGRGGRGGQRTVTEPVTKDGRPDVARLDRPVDVAAFDLAGDGPDQAGPAGLGRAGCGPESRGQRRPVARHGVKVAVVGQAPDRTQADAQRPRGGVAVSQGRAHVRKTRSRIDGDQLDPWLLRVPVDGEQQASLAGVFIQVRGRLGHREGQLVGAGGRELQAARHRQDGVAAGGHGAGVLDPEPSHVLGRRGLQRPVQRDHLTTTTLVPLPALEVSSNSSTSRRAPDKPRPSPWPVVQPSVRARSISGMPGPSSEKPILTPLLPLAGRDDLDAGPCRRPRGPGRCGRARWPRSPPWSDPPGKGRFSRLRPGPAAERGRRRLPTGWAAHPSSASVQER